MSKTLLITRPEYDPATRYLSRWSGKIKEKAEEISSFKWAWKRKFR